MVVTGSNLFNQAWMVLYKTISGNVTDPVSRGGSAWIFADFPEIQEGKQDDFPGFPIITIDNFENTSSNITSQKMENNISTVITVHTKDRKTLDTLSSDIHNVLVTSKPTIISSGLHAMTFSSGGVDTYAFDRNNKIHTKMIGVNFKVNL